MSVLHEDIWKPLCLLWGSWTSTCSVIHLNQVKFNSSAKGFDLTFNKFFSLSLRVVKQIVHLEEQGKNRECRTLYQKKERNLWPGWSKIMFKLRVCFAGLPHYLYGKEWILIQRRSMKLASCTSQHNYFWLAKFAMTKANTFSFSLSFVKMEF